MFIKEARVKLAQLLQEAQRERLDNIRTAFENGRSIQPESMKPYKTAANKALVRGINEVLGLVEEQPE